MTICCSSQDWRSILDESKMYFSKYQKLIIISVFIHTINYTL